MTGWRGRAGARIRGDNPGTAKLKFCTGPSAKLASSNPFEDKFSFFDEADTPAHAAAQNLTTEQKKPWVCLS